MPDTDQPGRQRCLVIDQGTHASRAAVFDPTGRSHGIWRQEITLQRIDRRCVEQDAGEILASVQAVVQQAAEDHLIDCVALTTQRSTVVAWDRAGLPLAPALSWQDTRGFEYLKPLDQKRIEQITGLVASPHYAASKMRWLLEHVSVVRSAHAQGRLFMGPLASFLLWHLTGPPDYLPRVDHTNAARTLLFNLTTRDWDPWLLEQFHLSLVALPVCRPVRHTYGILRGTGALITCVCGDQTAALHASGAPRPDTAYVNVGTGAFVLVPTGSQPVRCEGLLCGLADSTETEEQYCIEGTVNGAGAALTWAADRWQIPDLSQQLHDWLQQIDEPPIFLNTVGGLGSPFWCAGPEPRLVDHDGRTVGEPGDTPTAAVAVAESILFLLQANLDRIRQADIELSRIQVSGGLAAVDGLCQRMADLAGLPVDRPDQSEATAQGAAWLAMGCPDTWLPQNGVAKFTSSLNSALQQRYKRFLSMIDPS